MGKLSSGRMRPRWWLFIASTALMSAPLFAQTSPLNDTGQTLCFDAATNGMAECAAANTGDGSTHPRQDARFGRDAQAGGGQLTKIGAGEAGFDFTKIANNGSELPASAALGSGPGDWACTRDNVTGLIWEVKTPANANDFFTFANASAVHAAAVNAAQLCGFNDWRVPTRRELLSIVHHGRSNPAIDTTFFPNTQNSFYHSIDIFAPKPAQAWIVDFFVGQAGARSQSIGSHVRLVSGTIPPEPDPRFENNSDGTVTDPATGLMWDRCVWGQTGTDCSGGSASTHNWQAALGTAVTANAGAGYLGYNDWRLPNRTELESLVDIARFDPAIDTDAFPNTPSTFFWSSTVAPSASAAWVVGFSNGFLRTDLQTDVIQVRLVRSGQSFDALVPTPPTNASATPGNAEATVSWTAPTDTGGSAITGYTVTGDPGGSCSVAGDVTECTITGLTNGTEYTFTVVATNDEGDSPPSIASASVIPVGPPNGVLQAQVEPTILGLVVSWVAPSDNGGTPMLSYRADANPSCEVTALADEVPGETAYSCTIGNLVPGQEYTVTVTAINAVGESTVVAGAGATPLPAPIPVPTLGTWALFSLILLMLLMVMPVLLRHKAI
jgi:hypothetical protein